MTEEQNPIILNATRTARQYAEEGDLPALEAIDEALDCIDAGCFISLYSQAQIAEAFTELTRRRRANDPYGLKPPSTDWERTYHNRPSGA